MISDEVRFGEACFEEATSGRTRVDVTMNYSDAPAGAAGEAVTNILPKPERNLKENLENLTRNIERGDPGGLGARTPAANLGTCYGLVWGRRAGEPGGPCTRVEGTALGSCHN